MTPQRATSLLLLATLVSMSLGPTSSVEATTSVWLLDPVTGAEWRSLTSEELVSLGFNETYDGWVTRNYGSLADFDTESTVTIFAAHQDEITIHDFTLYNTSTYNTGIRSFTTPSASTIQNADTWNATIRKYADNYGWKAFRESTRGQFTALNSDQKLIFLWGPHDALTDIGTSDYIYSIEIPCTSASGDKVKMGDTSENCNGGDDDDDPEPPEPKDVEVATFGEMGWCEQHPAFVTDMEATFSRITTAFSSTDAEPVLTWSRCYTADGTYDHNADNYVHDHLPWLHPYPFNIVDGEHATGACETSNTAGYLNAQIVHDGNDESDIYERDGIWALYDHEAEHDYDLLEPDIILLFHDEAVLHESKSAAGKACRAEQTAITTDRTADGNTAPHEIGHLMSATHCDAEKVTAGWTIMAAKSANFCYDADYDNEDRLTAFSNANIANINNWVGFTYD